MKTPTALPRWMTAAESRAARFEAVAGVGEGEASGSDYTTAIIMPARDEQTRIGAAIDALAVAIRRQRMAHVVVVANNCVDDTVRIAMDRCAAHKLSSTVLDVTLASTEGVGVARALGFTEAVRRVPGASYLLGSDADCLVDPDWILRNIEHLDRVDAVCGRVEPIETEADALPKSMQAPGALEHEYLQLILESASRHDPDPWNPWPHHGRASGASQGFTRDAYEAAGGYAPLLFEEDRDIIDRLRAGGRTVVYADDVRVRASCRLDGRAPDGMADALARRVGDPDSLADSLLEPACTHLLRVQARAECRWRKSAGLTLSPVYRQLGLAEPLPQEKKRLSSESFGDCWARLEATSPLLARKRLRPSELPGQIRILESVLSTGKLSNTNARTTGTLSPTGLGAC